MNFSRTFSKSPSISISNILPKHSLEASLSSNSTTSQEKLCSASSQCEEQLSAMQRKLNALLSCLCVNSNSHKLDIDGMGCSICNKVFCDSCSVSCSCLRCSKRVCSIHCVKCHLCDKRACKSKLCICDFRICQLCEFTFCQDHFDQHKLFNNSDQFSIKCHTKNCKINFKTSLITSSEFLTSVVNASLIRELKLRKLFIRRKQFGR